MQTRCFIIQDDFITCDNCQLNYEENSGEAGFCQEFGIIIDADEKARNNKRAMECLNWLPQPSLSRVKCKPDAPELSRWYEKDSMG